MWRFAPNIANTFAGNKTEKLITQIAVQEIPRSLALRVAGRNLHTWTGYTGVDPENMFLSGTPNFLEQSNLPQLASFVFSAHVSF